MNKMIEIFRKRSHQAQAAAVNQERVAHDHRIRASTWEEAADMIVQQEAGELNEHMNTRSQLAAPAELRRP